MKKGYIYLITDKTNNKKYVGQTSRDIWTRFEEHCRSKIMTPLHQAIQEKGHLNFKLEEIEQVELDDLDVREKYWINHLNTFETGYNATVGGRGIVNYKHLKIVENGYIVDSATALGAIIHQNSTWGEKFITNQIKKAQQNKETFLDYHFEETDDDNFTDDDKLTEWAKTLTFKFCGKSIYCNELNKDFETIADCAKYLIDNNLYTGSSRTPIQSLVTSIGKQLHGKIDYVNSTMGNLTFDFLPIRIKNPGSNTTVGIKSKIYCPQLDKTFDSQIEAANYFLENKIWTNIKLKTAKLRISDVVRGAFPDYKGYTFEKVE